MLRRVVHLSILHLAAAAFALPSAAAVPSGADAAPEAGPVPVWVFFRDKGVPPADVPAAIERARASLTPRALARRAKTRGVPIADLLDVPLDPRQVAAVETTGARVRARSRWLNAVSIEANARALTAIRALPFVARVQPVAAGRPEPIDAQPVDLGAPPPAPSPRALNYGHCASQILPIQVNLLHDAGYSGAGVYVCVLDTGFLRTHQALDQVDVVAERDFIHDDGVTSNEPGDDPDQHNHGTFCLSILAGFDPGNLIGPAYGASFLLGKTEEITSETQVEEDYWIEAAEWADSLGADVISSSLSYIDWYTYEDMDGDTAPITIAADLATVNGISVHVAAGNQGDDPWFYIGAPADGDTVIAVGAVDSLGVIAPFSSHGPTADGRTKPDICAMGRGNLFAHTSGPSDYARGSGTSFACPLAAGVAALLLQAHPTWGPMQVGSALRQTASNAGAPNNDYGWGIIRAWNASQISTAAPEVPGRGGAVEVVVAPNPMHDGTTIAYAAPPGVRVTAADIADVTGRRVRTLNVRDATGSFTWDGRDETGASVPGGIYFARITTNRGIAAARVVRLR